MSTRALFNVTVAGTNIDMALMPVLLDLQVSDKVGTHNHRMSATRCGPKPARLRACPKCQA